MAYSDIVQMAQNNALIHRCAAAAAQEGKTATSPVPWVLDRMWHIASSPGWSEAWVAGRNTYPGLDIGTKEDVVTDGMILAVIQAMP